MRDGVDSIMNPYDLFALEAALRIKAQLGATISVISMGPSQAEQVIREAYYMGADRGYLLSDRAFAGADTLATSYTLARGIEKIGAFDLIICGLQTTDGDTAQVGPGIGEVLGIPHESNVIQIKETKADQIIVMSDMGTKFYTKAIQLPCLLSVTKDVGEPRLLSYRLKKERRDWPVVTFTAADFRPDQREFFGLSGSPTQVERTFAPTSNQDHEIWHGESSELSLKLSKKLRELRFVRGGLDVAN
jgi:electron transfer flavoprotein beta subunit